MLLISMAITRKLDFQELGGRKVVGRHEVMGESSSLLCTQNTHVGKLRRVSFLYILLGYLIVLPPKEEHPPPPASHPPVMINIFLERDCLSGILLGKGSTTFFCKELHSKYFGFCKSRGKIKALQGYVGTCTRTMKNGKAILGLQAGRNQAATPICLQILLLGEACAYITFITV